MPQRVRRVGCGQIPDLNAVAARPRGYISTIDGEDVPVPRFPDIPFEQGRVGPLLGNDGLQLPHLVFVRLDAEANGIEPVSEVFIDVGSTPTFDLQSSELVCVFVSCITRAVP